MRTPSDGDQALAAAFLLGELADPERGAFESRLAAEPELAAHVESLMATDELMRRHTRRGAVSPRQATRFRALPLLVAAAAVVVAIVGGALLLRTKPGRADAQVALCPSYESAAEWIARVPELSGQKPPGLDELRGPGEPANADPRAFAEVARKAELRALDAPAADEMTAPFYSVLLRLESDSDVVVAAFPANSSSPLLWPRPGEFARVLAGDRVLPGPGFRHIDDVHGSRVQYSRGFLVPIGAERVTVVVGTRSASPRPLDSSLDWSADSADAQTRKLEALGFAVRTFVVHEPD